MKTANYLMVLFMLGMVVSLGQSVNAADPVGTAFTYQGRLIDEDKPADGTYAMAFELYDKATDGSQIGSTVKLTTVEVIDGYFTVELDFGADAFNGDKRWLEILIDKNGWITLEPRQPVNPTPYAIAATKYVGPGTNGQYLYKSGSNWIARKPTITPNPHDNMQPYQVVNFVIALQGIYPSRNGAEPFLGEIMMAGFNFAPRGWATCDGQLLPISQNSALFSLLGTMYGGDGRTTFGLPDLRGRVPVHKGNGPGLSNRNQGHKGGTETTTLTVN